MGGFLSHAEIALIEARALLLLPQFQVTVTIVCAEEAYECAPAWVLCMRVCLCFGLLHLNYEWLLLIFRLLKSQRGLICRYFA